MLRAAVVLAAAGLVLVAAACDSSEPDPTPTPEPTPTSDVDSFQAVRVTPPIPKPDLVLTDQDGAEYDLRAETEGYVTLFYIGYTHCPDVCPTHLLDIAKSLESLPASVTDNIKVVVLTADPERDTPEVMKDYLALFDEDFIGLTGTRDQMDAAQQSVGLEPATRTDLGDGNYAVNHAAYVMAFGDDEFAHIVFPLGVTRETWAHDLTKLVTEGWTEEG